MYRIYGSGIVSGLNEHQVQLTCLSGLLIFLTTDSGAEFDWSTLLIDESQF